jgi:hypothetical protein
MMRSESSVFLKKGIRFLLLLALWIFTAWLFYPLFTLDAIQMANAKLYLFRAAIGIAIMLCQTVSFQGGHRHCHHAYSVRENRF